MHPRLLLPYTLALLGLTPGAVAGATLIELVAGNALRTADARSTTLDAASTRAFAPATDGPPAPSSPSTRMQGDTILDGALIGFGAGLAAGYVMTPARDRDHYAEAAFVYGYIGAGIGALTDALLSSTTAHRPSTSHLAPLSVVTAGAGSTGSSHDPVTNGALWGLASGAAFGAAFALGFSDHPSVSDITQGAMIFGGLGAGIGALADALTDRHRGAASARRLRLRPVVGRTAGAVHGVVRW